MALTVIGIAILAVGGFWIFGGVVLRVVGAVFAFVGVVSLVTLANPAALFMVVLGLVMWLAGHWHFACDTTNTRARWPGESSCRSCRRAMTRRAIGALR